MAKTKKTTEIIKEATKKIVNPSLRGRTFRGIVIKKFSTRDSIELERTIYVKKYERYAKKQTKLHARLPEELSKEIQIGDYIEIKECRPLSKIIHFIVVKKLKGTETGATK